MSGGYPAATQYDVLIRNAAVRDIFSSGRIPASLDEIGGVADVLPSHIETNLAVTDVYYTHWQGGGGYGDPLLREPQRVALDVSNYKVSLRAARDVYGVLLDASGAVDSQATVAHRLQLRQDRVNPPSPINVE